MQALLGVALAFLREEAVTQAAILFLAREHDLLEILDGPDVRHEGLVHLVETILHQLMTQAEYFVGLIVVLGQAKQSSGDVCLFFFR